MKKTITTITTLKANDNIFIAYALWFFLGAFGAHRIYVGRVRSGITMLGLNFFAIVFVSTIIGVILAFPIWLGLAIWWAIDAFLMLHWGLKPEIQLVKKIEVTK